MTQPLAYDPQDGYRWQILCRHPEYNGREWEHCDYAATRQERKDLLTEYRLAYDAGYQFKTIYLTNRYHPAPKLKES